VTKRKELFAPAKINLVLCVLFRRPDGYHELFTVFQKITLFDRLRVELTEAGLNLELAGPVKVPKEGNLCLKAAETFLATTGLKKGAKIRLYKEIPVGAGLGGGSSNAAAVLKALNELCRYPLTESDLLKLARSIGADVPFFVSSYSTALARGIGDILEPWPTHPAWYVLVFPGFKISTAWAYQNLRLTTRHKPPNYEPAQPLWRQGLVNDFETVVFETYPVLKTVKDFLLELGAVAALLSGSGATVFGVFEEREEAQEAKEAIEKRGLKALVVTNFREEEQGHVHQSFKDLRWSL